MPVSSRTNVRRKSGARKWFSHAPFLLLGGGLLALVLLIVAVLLWRGHVEEEAERAALRSEPTEIGDDSSSRLQVTLDPTHADVRTGGSLSLVARVSGVGASGVFWEVAEGDAGGRVVEAQTLEDAQGASHMAAYTAPQSPGKYHVIVTSRFDSTKMARAELNVTRVLASNSILSKREAPAPATANAENLSGADLLKRGNAAMDARKYREALHWFTQAAQQGNARAQFELAEMYFLGKGVGHDFQYAIRLYRQSAEQKYAPAQHALGTMYRDGFGVPKDEREAEAWFQKAAQNGYRGSK